MTRFSIAFSLTLAIIGIIAYVLISSTPFQPEPQIPFILTSPTPTIIEK